MTLLIRKNGRVVELNRAEQLVRAKDPYIQCWPKRSVHMELTLAQLRSMMKASWTANHAMKAMLASVETMMPLQLALKNAQRATGVTHRMRILGH